MATELELSLYQQNTDLEILAALVPYLKDKSFIDIGAEKGAFTLFLHSLGLNGIFFEPLPAFAAELTTIAADTHCTFLPYAVDTTDRTADFYSASDHNDVPMEYFSSLHPLEHDQRINHMKVAQVTCRSLDSLLHDKQINPHVGIIKIDTEGNDLNVLKGMTEIKSEVLMCEYFMPGIYAGWELGHPLGLIEEAKKLGFNHFIAIKRIEEFELTSLDNSEFIDKQWGNIIFLSDDIFHASKYSLQKIMAKKETVLLQAIVANSEILKKEIAVLREAAEKRLEVITAMTSNKIFNSIYTKTEQLKVLLRNFKQRLSRAS